MSKEYQFGTRFDIGLFITSAVSDVELDPTRKTKVPRADGGLNKFLQWLNEVTNGLDETKKEEPKRVMAAFPDFVQGLDDCISQ